MWIGQPVTLVLFFAVFGAFFMPYLAASLLYLGNKIEWMGAHANTRLGNAALFVCLVVFGVVCVREIVSLL